MAVINLRELLVRDVLVKVKASFLTVLESEGSETMSDTSLVAEC